MSVILALDLGTSAIKCMAMNERADVLHVSSVPYPSHTPNSGWLQQNPDDWIRVSVQAIKQCLAAIGQRDIEVISLTGHMSGLILTDDDGRPLYPCITLSDSRSYLQSEWLRQKAQEKIYASTGNPVIDAFLLPKLLWVKENLPSVYQQTKHLLFPKDYLRYHLTGKYATDITDAGNSLFYDFTKESWDEQLLAALEIRPDILPEILRPYGLAGAVNQKAARLFGLKEGIPVVTGAADMAAKAVGYGINEPGHVAATIGTSATILTLVPGINSIGRDKITFHPHVAPGNIYALGSHFSGGMSLNWFSGLISGDQSRADYSLIQSLSKEAENVLPGSGGTLYLPFLSGSGTPYFDAYARGSFLGLSTSTKRETMFHAVLEGISYNLKESLLLFEAMSGKIKTIRVGGGGMNIKLWPTILADVFGYPVDIIKISDASAIGAAIIGGFGVGIFADLNTPVQRIIENKRTVVPNAEAVAIYNKYFDIYQKSYQNLKSICQELVIS
jgi:xylulokinase